MKIAFFISVIVIISLISKIAIYLCKKYKIKIKYCFTVMFLVYGIIALTSFFIYSKDISVTRNKVSKESTNKTEAVEQKASEDKDVYNIINSNTLNVSYLNNGESGCILVQYNKKIFLIDCGKKDETQNIENSLKGHLVDNIYGLILTTSDKDSIGSAAELIKKYKVQEVSYINDEIKKNSYFNEIELAAEKNGFTIKKTQPKYNIDNAVVNTSVDGKVTKIEFQFKGNDDSRDVKTMSFVKDTFESNRNIWVHHNVGMGCDSEGNINLTILTYHD